MNLSEMRLEFDEVMRTLMDTDFLDQRDRYINAAWRHISEMYDIPSLVKTLTFDSVANQKTYALPYDYNGTELFLWYKSTSSSTPRRLDPVKEDVLALMYERRSGNMGPEWYYDWTGPVGSDYAVRAVTLANNSTTVACAAAAAGDVDRWVRFDPWDATVNGSTVTYNPGDYGYYISAVTPGVSYTLSLPYRGPAGSTNARVTPAETQQIILYGIPNSSTTDAFTLRYYSQPARLYNDTDVPEYPSMGVAVVYMAISIANDYLRNNDYAKVWWGRAMGRITGLRTRREATATLVSDLTVGSVSGRITGARSVDMGRHYSRR